MDPVRKKRQLDNSDENESSTKCAKVEDPTLSPSER